MQAATHLSLVASSDQVLRRVHDSLPVRLSTSLWQGGRKVAATSRCVHILRDWGYLERQPSRTTVTMFEDAEGGLSAQLATPASPDEAEVTVPTLPAGVRKGTQQAKAWLVLARRAGLQAAVQARSGGSGSGDLFEEAAAVPAAAAAAAAGGAGGGGGGTAAKELVQREVETETFDSWGLEVGLDATQFGNAVRALQTKGLVSVARSPTLQVRIPGEARSLPLPAKDDERAIKLAEERKHGGDKLRAVESYIKCSTSKGGSENDVLWRQITSYFGEEDVVPESE